MRAISYMGQHAIHRIMGTAGVLIDGQLSMADHVASLCRSCFFQLRQLRLVRSSLTPEAANVGACIHQ